MSKNDVATISGFLLVVAGLLGFADPTLLGVFVFGFWQNLTHLISGACVVLIAAGGAPPAKVFFRITGAAYILLGSYGFLVPRLEFFGETMNRPDHALHLLVGMMFLWTGFFALDSATSSGAK